MTKQLLDIYTQVTNYKVDEEYENSRLDNCLISLLKGLPKSKIYSIIRKGEVRVNGSRSKPDRRLGRDDIVRIPPYKKVSTAETNRPSKNLKDILEDNIIYFKDSVLIINKPEGLASHGGSGLKLGLIEAVRQIDKRFVNAKLVHRLDRGTSGCIVLALKRSILRTLNTEIREGRVEKNYIAVVSGNWPTKEEKITSKLKKNSLRSGEREVIETSQGKRSITIIKRIKGNKELSLLDCSLVTGRTHQIRVQLSGKGYPIIGDKKYGDSVINKNYKRKSGVNRMLLHAKEINFPVLGIKCKAKEPSIFNKLIYD